MKEIIQCLKVRNKKTPTFKTTLQSGSRNSEGLDEANHFCSLPRIRSIWQMLETGNKYVLFRPQTLFIKSQLIVVNHENLVPSHL